MSTTTPAAITKKQYKQNTWTIIPPEDHARTLELLRAAIHTKEELQEVKAPLAKSGVKAAASTPTRWHRNAVVIDCEMVGVGYSGSALVYICAVDFLTGEVLVDSLVYPPGIGGVTDWRTRIHGIKKEDVLTARTNGTALLGVSGAREELFKFVGADTIIIGHAVRNDLKVLKFQHSIIVDSQVLLSKNTSGMLAGLKDATLSLLGKVIQKHGATGSGHDCQEDVMASRELVLYCLNPLHDTARNTWGAKWVSERRPPPRQPPITPKTEYAGLSITVVGSDDDVDHMSADEAEAYIRDLCFGYDTFYGDWEPGYDSDFETYVY